MTSVLGIELGSKKQDVRTILATKQPKSKIYSQTDISISYEGITWGEYETLLVIFQFSDSDQLHTVIFEADYPQKCNYDRLRTELKRHGFSEIVSGFQNVFKKMNSE